MASVNHRRLPAAGVTADTITLSIMRGPPASSSSSDMVLDESK